MNHTLYVVAITPKNEDGGNLQNSYLNGKIARAAADLPGVVAASWTQHHAEMLVNARDTFAAEDIANVATMGLVRNAVSIRVLAEDDYTQLNGLARQCAELTGVELAAPDLVEAYGRPQGMVFSPMIDFTRHGLTADGIIGAMVAC